MEFYPEGHRIETTQNRLRTASLFALAEAAKSQDILEGKAVVGGAAHNPAPSTHLTLPTSDLA